VAAREIGDEHEAQDFVLAHDDFVELNGGLLEYFGDAHQCLR
jgi:hypothetical protein